MVQGRAINLTRYLFILVAIMTAFLPCVTFGQIAEVLDAGEMSKDPLPNLPSLQKNGSKAAFLKRGHRAKKCSYSPIWPIAAFFLGRKAA